MKKNKLILPKPHLSWTQLNCWETSKKRYRKEYFECASKLDTKYLRFGKGIAEMIDNGTYKKLLPYLIVYKETEYEIRTDICGVPILAYIDDYDPDVNLFREKKTGKIPWTQARVIKHGQLLLYATALKHDERVGKIPDHCHLDWMETAEGPVDVQDFWRQNERAVKVTGKIESFKREFDEREIKKMEQRIVKAANEISEAYISFLNEI